MKILLVEDNKSYRKMLNINLLRAGHEVMPLEIYDESKLKDFMPDLVITDLMMPERDGHDVIRSVKNIFKSTPVWVLSSNHNDANVYKGLALGADKYLFKDKSISEVLSDIEMIDKKSVLPLKAYQYKLSEVSEVEVILNDSDYLTVEMNEEPELYSILRIMTDENKSDQFVRVEDVYNWEGRTRVRCRKNLT